MSSSGVKKRSLQISASSKLGRIFKKIKVKDTDVPINTTVVESVLKKQGPDLLTDSQAARLNQVCLEHRKLCGQLMVQARGRSSEINFLRIQSFYRAGSQSNLTGYYYNLDGKRINSTVSNSGQCRLSFLNGGSAYFPLKAWTEIWQHRCEDIKNGILCYDNEIALNVTR